MKYCLSYKAASKALKQADEILLEYKDLKMLPDLGHQYPEASFLIINVPTNYDGTVIINAKRSCRNGITFVIPPSKNIVEDFLHNLQCKFMFSRVATDMYMVDIMKANGADRIMVGGDLLFNADRLVTLDIAIMICPLPNNFNNKIEDLAIVDEMRQAFIRPEDMIHYDGEEVYCHFLMDDLDGKYFDIYAIRKTWSGSLGVLFKNNIKAKNIYLPERFGTIRASCGRHCSVSGCRYCTSAATMAETIKQEKVFLEESLDKI